MIKPYNRANWFWIVAGKEDHGVWSSASGAFVSLNDEAYLVWLEQGYEPMNIASFNDVITITIEALEGTVTERRRREAELGGGVGWLQTLDAKIASLRTQMTH